MRMRSGGAALLALVMALGLGACMGTEPTSTSAATEAGVVETSGDAQAQGSPTPEDGPDDAAPDTIEAYVVKGRVTTQDGRPLPGVEVGAENTFGYSSYLYGVTDDDGHYRIDLSGAPNTTWRMFGTVKLEYEGTKYNEELYVDTTSFPSDKGAIRDFEWRLTGPKGDYDLRYGGSIYVVEDKDWDLEDPPEIEEIEWVTLTLDPVGPLIDGSEGEQVVRAVGDYWIHDVPKGRYRISATYTEPRGIAEPLVIRPMWEEIPYERSIEMVFDTSGEMRLQVMIPS